MLVRAASETNKTAYVTTLVHAIHFLARKLQVEIGHKRLVNTPTQSLATNKDLLAVISLTIADLNSNAMRVRF